MTRRRIGRTEPGWKKDLRVRMRDAGDKEVDMGAVSTETDQHSPGKSYLYQFFYSQQQHVTLKLKKAL